MHHTISSPDKALTTIVLVAAPQMYLFCLFMRVLLSWFSSIDWNAQPWAFLRLVGELLSGQHAVT